MTHTPRDTPETDVNLDAILRDLSSFSPANAKRGERHAQALPPEQLACLAEQGELQFRSRMAVQQLLVPVLLGIVAALLIDGIVTGHYEHLFVGLWLCMAAIAVEMADGRCYRVRKRLAALLSQRHDPRLLGPTLMMLDTSNLSNTRSALFSRNFVYRRSLIATLKRMLPQVRPDHSEWLDGKQRQALLALLDRPKADPMLTLAVLQALGQIGDEWAVPKVRLLARDREYAGSEEIQKAAHHCLPFLQANAEQKRQHQTLLRPSAAHNETADMLLRPAAQTAATPAEQLLRPH